jgi:nucleoside-diphosphate-sugar epimerase
MNTVLVTGGTGFLGSNLLKHLASGPAALIVLKRSFSVLSRLRDFADRLIFYDVDRVPLRDVFSAHHVDTVIHCATNYGRSPVPPTEVIEANLLLPLQLLQLAAEHGTTTFVNTDTILDKRMNHYSLSKSQFLEWLPEFARAIACINVELEHFYGPYDDPSKFVSHVIQTLLTERPWLDLTPGEQRRDFVFVDDVVSAIDTLLHRRELRAPGIYHFEVGCGESVTIADFVRAAKRIAQNHATELRFGALPYREREVMESRANVTKLRALGWRPRVSLMDGLQRTISAERRRLGQCDT